MKQYMTEYLNAYDTYHPDTHQEIIDLSLDNKLFVETYIFCRDVYAKAVNEVNENV